MWIYEKQLEYPVNITKPDPRMAKLLLAQYGGPDSELGAALRYLTQRYSMPDDRVRATLTDIGTEELAHWEMLGTMIRQCMQGLSTCELDAAGLSGYYVMHDHGVFPADPNGVPFTSSYIACTGDPVADLVEDMAAEQKARVTYEHLMNMTSNSQIIEPLYFLREREVVHYQRFGECLEIVQQRYRVRSCCSCRNNRR
ncbi:MAG TPA: manganese catalase family protein [Eubacteriales bacterium]|nr:manganese catalase family protein [Clostridia bacterium]HRV73610.1 manganese catalase family protein [Eubacteriales bacterium]